MLIDFREDRFVSPPRAADEAGLTARRFRRLKHLGLLPVYLLPGVPPQSSPNERYLVSELRAVARGAFL